MIKNKVREKYTTIHLFVGERSTNINVGDIYEAVNIEVLVENVDLVEPFLEWVEKVPASIRLQFFAGILDKQRMRDEIGAMLEKGIGE